MPETKVLNREVTLANLREWNSKRNRFGSINWNKLSQRLKEEGDKFLIDLMKENDTEYCLVYKED